MVEIGASGPPPYSPRRRWQFGIGTLLLAAIPVSLLAAALGGMLGQGKAKPLMPAAFFVLLSIATPLALLIVTGVARAIAVRWKDSRRHR